MTELGTGNRRDANTHVDPAVSLARVEHATTYLLEAARGLDETSVRAPSLLPGWNRAHVLSHVARSADGFVNLLTWARTGVEHPMYSSRDDRDADIREGALRHHYLLVEDVSASAARFAHTARTLPDSAWTAEVVGAPGKHIPAHEILRSRLLEVWVHLVDLDRGFGFDDIPQSDIESLLNDAVRQFAGRPDVPAMTVTTTFDDGGTSTWEIGGAHAPDRRLYGRPGALLGWLLGRTDGQRLNGDAPDLPPWL